MKDEIIGYAILSRFHIEGRYENELLILIPVAVKTELQRQHISKDLLEYGFKKARAKHPPTEPVGGCRVKIKKGILPTETNHDRRL